MDSASMNHYEKQLYTVFKTFDVDNEEALNRSAVVELCDALQLEERGAALVDSLFERRADRVTFAQFRNGLLSVLSSSEPSDGDGPPAGAGPAHHCVPSDAKTAPSFLQSDDDSSNREIAPRFVFGPKKYGRRSRPQRPLVKSDKSTSPRAASVSRLDTEERKNRISQQMSYRRSTSAMDSRERQSVCNDERAPVSFDHDQHINYEQALTLCRDLQMEGIDQAIVQRIFEESSNDEMTVGKFFERLNMSLTSSLEGTHVDATMIEDVDDVSNDESKSGLSCTIIIDAWKRVGIPQPCRLLHELGFTASTVCPSSLEKALDNELGAYTEPPSEPRDARVVVSAAALELARLRLRRAARRAERAAAERDKLRADLGEANRRALLLAQDNDEQHARMEAELAASARRADARHAEEVRRAAAELATERERAAALCARLDAELAQRADAEARLREEAEAQKARVAEMESRAATAEARAAAAEREAARLRSARPPAADCASAAEAAAQREALAAQLAALRAENQRLRDRVDELCGALEARPAPAPPPAAAGQLSAELGHLMASDPGEESDSAPSSIDQNVMSYPETVRRLQTVTGAASGALAGGSCCGCDVAVQTDPLDSQSADLTDIDGPPVQLQDAEALRRELCDMERKHDEEKRKLEESVKDLEASLEQMRVEYERCEEYWSGKLREERELLAEEQRASDERLGELVAKIGEFERRFGGGGLPPIEERAALEAQVAALDDEFAAYRRERDAELAEARRQGEEARARAAAAERRRARCACAALGAQLAEARGARAAQARAAAALSARAARAEGAARRLSARLAAADLLVKELYVENCQLAHRRAL